MSRDMLLMPDSTTALHRSVLHAPTLSVICSVADPVLGEPYAPGSRASSRRRPSGTLWRVGIADVAYFGPEAEFFVFDHVAYEQRRAPGVLRDRLAARASGTPARSGARSRTWATSSARRRGTSRSRRPTRSPTCAARWWLTMESLGIRCEFHHHEVSSGGQGEIDMRFQPLLRDGRPDDDLQVRGQEHRRTPRARPRRSCRSRSSRRTGPGCTCHQSLWKDGDPLMYGEGRIRASERPGASTTSAGC